MSGNDRVEKVDGVETAIGEGSTESAKNEVPANGDLTSPSSNAAYVSDAAGSGGPAARSRADAEPESANGVDATTDADADADAVAARAREVEAALEASREQTLRAQAEMENLRRRAQRDVENAHRFGLEKFVTEILPVLDSMELGLEAARQEGAGVESLREGTELTVKMLQGALAKFEVAEIDPQGEPFDPEKHQAMSVQEVEGTPSGQVLQVIQKGYTLGGRLVRPAMVVVAK